MEVIYHALKMVQALNTTLRNYVFQYVPHPITILTSGHPSKSAILCRTCVQNYHVLFLMQLLKDCFQLVRYQAFKLYTYLCDWLMLPPSSEDVLFLFPLPCWCLSHPKISSKNDYWCSRCVLIYLISWNAYHYSFFIYFAWDAWLVLYS